MLDRRQEPQVARSFAHGLSRLLSLKPLILGHPCFLLRDHRPYPLHDIPAPDLRLISRLTPSFCRVLLENGKVRLLAFQDR